MAEFFQDYRCIVVPGFRYQGSNFVVDNSVDPRDEKSHWFNTWKNNFLYRAQDYRHKYCKLGKRGCYFSQNTHDLRNMNQIIIS